VLSAKWLSFSVGTISSALVAALLLYAQGSGLNLLTGETLDVLTVALSVGTLVGLSLALWVSRWNVEIRKLVTYADDLGRLEKSDVSPYRALPGFSDLQHTIDRSVGSLRKRVEQLTTERRELEVQMRLAEAERQHAEAILNSIHDAVVVTDAFNEVSLVNKAASRVLDFDLERALRRPIERVVTDPTLVKLIKDTREGGDRTTRRHVEHQVDYGAQTATYDVTLSCVTQTHANTNQPETAGVVTIMRDVTREKEIAEMKSDFVSNVSHELRTPLSSIKAYMEMLVDGEAEDEQTRSEFYNIIQGETNRLQRLIDNILNISRIEAGVVKVHRESIKLPELVKEVINVMQPQARAKQIELIERPSTASFEVFADKDMIYQSTLNLVSNAIKYTPAGGRVTVAISVDDRNRRVNVSVTDTGVGIPKQDIPFLFDKFYRVNNHKKIAKGTGLGLNLVKHLIETVHGGRVRVLSEIGKGSSFIYSLPLADRKAV